MKILTCLQCQKAFTVFYYHSKAPRRFCSRACFGASVTLKEHKACLACGKNYFPKCSKANYGKSNYCSHRCSTLFRKGKPLLAKRKYGDEATLTDSETGFTDVYIRGVYKKGPRKGRTVWKRKAAAVLEEVLGRKLRHNELRFVIYIDGNRLNCRRENLLLLPHRESYTCEICGKHRSAMLSTIKNFQGTCRECLQKYGWPNVRKLSLEEIALIKSLGSVSCAELSLWFPVGANQISGIRRGERWKGVLPMAAKEVWKTLLTQYDRLMKRAGATLFESISLLAKVYEDEHYLEYVRSSKKSATEMLDERIKATYALNFTVLYQMYKFAPRKEEWADIGNLYQRYLEHLKSTQSPSCNGNGKPKKSKEEVKERRAATLAQVQDLKESLKSKDTEVEHLRKELQTANNLIQILQEQLEQKQEMIGTLRENNAFLQSQMKRGQEQPAEAS